MKLQAPTSKLQKNFKLQYPKCTACSFFELGNWNFIGAWMLELGVFAVEKATDVGAWNLEFPNVRTILLHLQRWRVAVDFRKG
jgi:hypothetical protein